MGNIVLNRLLPIAQSDLVPSQGNQDLVRFSARASIGSCDGCAVENMVHSAIRWESALIRPARLKSGFTIFSQVPAFT
jgi:hypothetical protein